MRNKRINGVQFEKMVKNGLQNLSRHEEEVNKLNVFPVPDGDTGTNMYLTLANGIKYAKSSAAIGVYTKALSTGMLLGARGNSGVILSQFFKGFHTELARSSFAGPGELRNALIRGYRTAYDSVIKPVEGTVLTVAREGIEHIRGQITRNSTIEEILAMYIAEMKKTISYTPEMLDVLKEAGVVDSGGQGFIYIFEGMLGYLYGDVYRTNKKTAPKEHSAPDPGKEIDFSLFNENSSFEDGYCTEFILQLLKGEKYTQRFKLETYIEDIGIYGDSLVVAFDVDKCEEWQANEVFMRYKGHRCVEYSISLKDGAVKAEVFRRNCWIPDMGRFEPVGNNIRASVRRDRDGVTKYWAWIPWANLGLDEQLKPGALVGFAAALYSSDGGKVSVNRLFDGIVPPLNPMKYGVLELK